LYFEGANFRNNKGQTPLSGGGQNLFLAELPQKHRKLQLDFTI
jgi:hypothetical protein